jgi:polyhydroxyalkanoate synthesis regulator phasin
MWDGAFHGSGRQGGSVFASLSRSRCRHLAAKSLVFLFLGLLSAASAAIPLSGRAKKDSLSYGEGLIVNIPLPEPEVAQVVEEIAQNTIIRGTKEYNKDEFVSGAEAVATTNVFPEWTEGGKIFYKVRKQALDPRNFKDAGDVGTLAVRYVVMEQGFQNTVLRIDAIFVEDFRRTAHPSDGSVENEEYKDIREHLDAVELMKKETAAALQAKQDRMAKENFGLGSDTVVLSTPPRDMSGQDANLAKTSSAPSALAPATFGEPAESAESLEQHVTELRRQVERLVKKPGAPLKSAPFHSASTLKSLDPGAEVLILISTPYWYGIETHDGQHGWLQRDQLEQVP